MCIRRGGGGGAAVHSIDVEVVTKGQWFLQAGCITCVLQVKGAAVNDPQVRIDHPATEAASMTR